MHSSLTLRITDVPRYDEHKIARQLGDRIGPFIGGEAYENRDKVYQLVYTTEPMSVDVNKVYPPTNYIYLPPPQAGLDYVKYTLTLVTIPNET
jgi:hypothetical protein